MLLKQEFKKYYFLYPLVIIFIIIPLRVVSQSSAAYTPPSGSPERKEILNTLRNHLKRNFRTDVVFVVGHFKVKNGWAWVETNPRSTDDKNVYEPIAALLRKTKGVWKIIDYAPGECTGDEEDSPNCYPKRHFESLRTKYKAPSEIFPEN